MGYVPKDARWYWADIVLEHTIEGEPRNVVHVNMHLIQADSPELAYKKAMALGRASKMSYLNSEGRHVRVKFCGLRQLDVIHDGLVDGEEITYTEIIDMPKAELQALRTPKHKLNVFRKDVLQKGKPNYLPETVVRKLEAQGYDRELLEGLAGIIRTGRKKRR